jgi:hypothetical protein
MVSQIIELRHPEDPTTLSGPLRDHRASVFQFQLFSFQFLAFTQKGAKGNVRSAMADVEMWMGRLYSEQSCSPTGRVWG